MSDQKNQHTPVQETKEFQEKVVDFILDNDIRVIFYGESHLDTESDTQLPVSLIQALCDSEKINLKGVYFECVNKAPDVNDVAESTQYRNKIIQEYKTTASDNDKPNTPQHLYEYEDIEAYLYFTNRSDKIFAFGRDHHEFTRKTLNAAIATVEPKEVIVISIGSAHLFEMTDAENKYAVHLVSEGDNPRHRSGKYRPADSTETATFTKVMEDKELGTVVIPTDSKGLVDYFAKIYPTFGILAINGFWQSAFSQQAPKFSFDTDKFEIIVCNRSVRDLAKRHLTNPKVIITKSYKNWDEADLDLMTSLMKQDSDIKSNEDDNDNDNDAKYDKNKDAKPNYLNKHLLEKFSAFDTYFRDKIFIDYIVADKSLKNFENIFKEKNGLNFGKLIERMNLYFKMNDIKDISPYLYFTSITGNQKNRNDPTDSFLRALADRINSQKDSQEEEDSHGSMQPDNENNIDTGMDYFDLSDDG